MAIIKFNDSMTLKTESRESNQNNIVDLTVNFLRNEHINKSLNNLHKEVIEKLLNHFTLGAELKLTEADLEVFENMEYILKPKLNSEDSMIMLYLYLTARCSLENASAAVIQAWKGFLAVFDNHRSISSNFQN